MIEVNASYEWEGEFELDEDAKIVAGRGCDYAGCDFGQRELGWYCETKDEAKHIVRALTNIGMKAELRP
jgi:hypothetical protein